MSNNYVFSPVRSKQFLDNLSVALKHVNKTYSDNDAIVLLGNDQGFSIVVYKEKDFDSRMWISEEDAKSGRIPEHSPFTPHIRYNIHSTHVDCFTYETEYDVNYNKYIIRNDSLEQDVS